jgi:divalent metal cation (Fe/Co/Zn/Cd) transporter
MVAVTQKQFLLTIGTDDQVDTSELDNIAVQMEKLLNQNFETVRVHVDEVPSNIKYYMKRLWKF